MSLFGAGWTLGAFKYLAENGIHSATFYETTGWQGVMETEGGSPLPGEFRSIPGAVFPMYHILADIGEYAGGQVFRSASSNPLMVDALLLSLGNKRSVLAANFTPEAVGVHFRDLPKQVRVRTLDETNVLDAMQNPLKYRQRGGNVLHSRQGCLNLDLNPCAAARIDFLGEN
jgi:hypothetical protein